MVDRPVTNEGLAQDCRAQKCKGHHPNFILVGSWHRHPGSWVDPKDHNFASFQQDFCGIEAARAAGLCAQRLAQQQGATAAKCAEDAGDFKGGVGWVWLNRLSFCNAEV